MMQNQIRFFLDAGLRYHLRYRNPEPLFLKTYHESLS